MSCGRVASLSLKDTDRVTGHGAAAVQTSTVCVCCTKYEHQENARARVTHIQNNGAHDIMHNGSGPIKISGEIAGSQLMVRRRRRRRTDSGPAGCNALGFLMNLCALRTLFMGRICGEYRLCALNRTIYIFKMRNLSVGIFVFGCGCNIAGMT